VRPCLSASTPCLLFLQSKDELDRLIQLEYWLKFDLTGCVRKLLPAHQQALCMVSRGREEEAGLWLVDRSGAWANMTALAGAGQGGAAGQAGQK